MAFSFMFYLYPSLTVPHLCILPLLPISSSLPSFLPPPLCRAAGETGISLTAGGESAPSLGPRWANGGVGVSWQREGCVCVCVCVCLSICACVKVCDRNHNDRPADTCLLLYVWRLCERSSRNVFYPAALNQRFHNKSNHALIPGTTVHIIWRL